MGAVDIWRVDLAVSANWVPGWSLSRDEEARASRLRAQTTRDRWMCSRQALRAIIAAHSGCDPADIRFEFGPFGKPRLAARDRAVQPLHFSLTRSGNLCLIATARDHPIGIDVEQMSTAGGEDLIAQRFFTPQEADAIGALSGGKKARAFLEVWTRKEACAKAVGMGLQYPLRDLDVSAADLDQPVISPVRINKIAAWRLLPLCPAAGYIGTLAVPDGSAAHRTPPNMRTFALDPQKAERLVDPGETSAGFDLHALERTP